MIAKGIVYLFKKLTGHLDCCCSVPEWCLTLFDLMDYIAHQAPLSMGFPRHEYWSELKFPSPGDLPDAGIEPASLALAGTFLTTEPHVPSFLNLPPTPNPIPCLPCHPVFFLFWGISKPFSKEPNSKYFMLCMTKAKLRILDKYFPTKIENKFLQILSNY